MPPRKQTLGTFMKDNVVTSFRDAIHTRSFLVVYLFHLFFFSAMIYTALKATSPFLQLLIIKESGVLAADKTQMGRLFFTQLTYFAIIFVIYWVLNYAVTAAVLTGFYEMRSKRKESDFFQHFVYGVYRTPTLIGISIISGLLVVPGVLISKLVERISLSAGSLIYDIYSFILALILLFAVPYAVLKKDGVITSIKKSYLAFRNNPVELTLTYIIGMAVAICLLFAFLVPVGVVLVLKISPHIAPLIKELGTAQQNSGMIVSTTREIVRALYQYRYWLIGGYVVSVVGLTLSYLFWNSYLVGLFRKYGGRK